MTDLADQLAAALDRAEQEATAGQSDAPPAWVLALVAHASADRNVADHVAHCGPDLCNHHDYTSAVATLMTLTTAVEAAARFWLPETEAADA